MHLKTNFTLNDLSFYTRCAHPLFRNFTYGRPGPENRLGSVLFVFKQNVWTFAPIVANLKFFSRLKTSGLSHNRPIPSTLPISRRQIVVRFLKTVSPPLRFLLHPPRQKYFIFFFSIRSVEIIHWNRLCVATHIFYILFMMYRR